MKKLPYKRIVIIGTSGSGKTTLGAEIESRFGVPHIELDALHWEPDWKEADDEVMRMRVQAAVEADTWMLDGNYAVARDLSWARAELLIWLDYPLLVNFWRLLKRTLRRAITHEEIWNGNHEPVLMQLKLWSDDSIFHWLFKTYWRRKREYPVLLALPDYAHLEVLHFTSPKETAAWLDSFAA